LFNEREGDESDEAALIRGIREEAGIEVTIGRYLFSDITPTNKRELKWYECFAQTYNVIPGSDLEDIKWVPKGNVPEECGSRVTALWSDEIRNYFRP